MDNKDSKYLQYKNDPRIACQYGAKCYQKSKIHHEKYKHPPKRSERTDLKPAKKRKLNPKPHDKDADVQKPEHVSDSNDEIEDNCAQQKEKCVSDSPEKEAGKECVSDSSEKEAKKEECVSDSFDESSDEEAKPESSTSNVTNNLGEINEAVSESAEKSPKPKSEYNPKKFIKTRFLLEPPSDFYDFWDFCKQLKPAQPSEALKDVGLKLVGPYDVLAEKFKHCKKSPEEYLCHWRYFYDPPEFQTVIKGDDKIGYHIGYFYDSPDEPPAFLASNNGTKDGVFNKMGDNVFAAVNLYLEDLKKSGDPFRKVAIGKIQAALKTKAEALKLSLTKHSDRIKKRENKVVVKTANKIGLVVPFNKKTQLGYRDLVMDDKDVQTLLNKLKSAAPEQKHKLLSDLQPVLTYASIALDECDFGTGIKLGWDILCNGVEGLESTISRFFCDSYNLLNKESFVKIATAHMAHRKKGSNLSIV